MKESSGASSPAGRLGEIPWLPLCVRFPTGRPYLISRSSFLWMDLGGHFRTSPRHLGKKKKGEGKKERKEENGLDQLRSELLVVTCARS